jgi:hypothetical protein
VINKRRENPNVPPSSPNIGWMTRFSAQPTSNSSISIRAIYYFREKVHVLISPGRRRGWGDGEGIVNNRLAAKKDSDRADFYFDYKLTTIISF